MSTDPELQRLRTLMDDVNRRLALVLHERARLCRAIGTCKRAHGMPAVDPAREQTMLAALRRDVPADGFTADQLAAILQQVFVASRAVVATTSGR